MSEPTLCVDCERSTGGACAQHPRFGWAKMPGDGPLWLDSYIKLAVHHEREACARLCETWIPPDVGNGEARVRMYDAAERLARLIRARGRKP